MLLYYKETYRIWVLCLWSLLAHGPIASTPFGYTGNYVVDSQ